MNEPPSVNQPSGVNQPLSVSDKPGLTGFWERRLASARLYPRRSDWLLSLYSRVLMRAAALPLPGRNRVRKIYLAGQEHPFYLRLGTTDWFSLEDVWVRHVYDPVLPEQPAARLIVDLGANVGFSIRLWQLHYPDAHIVGVEPDGENLDLCRLNIVAPQSAGRSLDNIDLVQACVAGRERAVRMDATTGEWSMRMRDIDEASAASFGAESDAASSTGSGDGSTVPAFTLPQILQDIAPDAPIDILKCVIMGAEAELFANCAPWIGRVRQLIVHLYRDMYSMSQLLKDIAPGGDFQIYHHVVYGEQSELLFLKRVD